MALNGKLLVEETDHVLHKRNKKVSSAQILDLWLIKYVNDAF